MSILSQTLKALLIFSMAFSNTLAYAAKSSPSSKNEDSKYDVKNEGESVVVTEKGSNTPEVTFQFENSSPEELEKQSPDEINKLLTLLLAEQKKQQSKTGGAVKAAFVHTAKSFVPETFKFALGMGVIAWAQLWINYSQNPLALQQHIEHQMSPLGSMGFGLFILSNGLTSNILGSKFGNNPAFVKMIPYLGMTAGFLSQSVFSQLAADPNFVECAKIHVGLGTSANQYQEKGIDKKPCTTAWKNFREIRLTPSLISMMLSTYVSMKGETWLRSLIANHKSTFEAAGSKIAKLSKFEILMSVTPTGRLITTGAKAVFSVGKYTFKKIAPIIAFTGLDMLIFNTYVTFHYQNFVDGKELYEVTERLVNQVNYLKSLNWEMPAYSASDRGSDSSPKADLGLWGSLMSAKDRWTQQQVDKKQSLSEQVLLFQKKMAAWRANNLTKVLEAHHSWSTSLTSLTSMFGASHGFYGEIVNQVRNHQFDLSPDKRLNTTYPLWGVIPDGLSESEQNAILTSPKMYELNQMETLKKVVSHIDQRLGLNGKYSQLNKDQKAQLTNIRNYLNGRISQSIVKGLTLFRSELIKAFKASSLPFSSSNASTYYEVLQDIRAVLGTAVPQMEPGRGLLLAYEEAPTMKAELKDVPFDREVGYFATPRITDYLLMQMICGPDLDANEPLIKTISGFAAKFSPPRLRTNGADFKNECGSYRAYVDSEKIYTRDVQVNGKVYRGFLTYLKDNMRPSALGTKDNSTFDKWWDARATTQLRFAFDDFEIKYNKIVADMVRALFANNGYVTGLTNQGPASNSIIPSILQEEMAYLSVLQEMIQPSSVYDFKLENARATKIEVASLQEIHKRFLGMVELLKKIRVVQKTPQEIFETKNPEMRGQSIKWAHKKSEKLEVIESALNNKDFVAQQDSIAEAVNQLAKDLAVNLAPTGKPASEREQAAKVTLQALIALAVDMANYGTIANAVSWDKLRDNDLKIEQAKLNENTEKALKASKGATSVGQ